MKGVLGAIGAAMAQVFSAPSGDSGFAWRRTPQQMFDDGMALAKTARCPKPEIMFRQMIADGHALIERRRYQPPRLVWIKR
jgi:hypothetical protein